MNELTPEEAVERLTSKGNLCNNIEKILRPKFNDGRGAKRGEPNPAGGRKPGDRNLTDFERTIIATAASISGSTKASRELGVSKETAQQLKDGIKANVTAENGQRELTVDASLKKSTKEKLDNIAELASDMIIEGLGLMKVQITAVEKPRELAGILKDMSTVMEKALPKDKSQDGPAVVFHLHNNQKSEAEFEAIDVTPIREGVK